MSYEDYDDDEYAPSRKGPRGGSKKRGKGRAPRGGPGTSREPGRDSIKRRGTGGPGPQFDEDRGDIRGRRRGPGYDHDRTPPRGRGPPSRDRQPRDRYMDYEAEYAPPPRRPPRGPTAYDDHDVPRGRGAPPAYDDHDVPRGRGAPPAYDDHDVPRGRGAPPAYDDYDVPRGRGAPPDDYYDRGPGYDFDRDADQEPSREHPLEQDRGSRGPREKRPSYTSLDVPMEKARRSRSTSFLFIGLCVIIMVTWFTISYLPLFTDSQSAANLKHGFEVKGFMGETPVEIESTLNTGSGTFLLVDEKTFDDYQNDHTALRNNNITLREDTKSAKFNIDLEPGKYFLVVQDSEGSPTNMEFTVKQYPQRPLLVYVLVIFGIIAVVFGIRAAIMSQRIKHLEDQMKHESLLRGKEDYDDIYGRDLGRKEGPGRTRRSDARGKPPEYSDYEGWGRPRGGGNQNFRSRR